MDVTDRLLLPVLRLSHRPTVGRGDVDGKIKERIVSLAGLPAGETGDAGLESSPEDSRHHRVGLRPQHPHLVVHTGQQVEQLRVKSDNNLASFPTLQCSTLTLTCPACILKTREHLAAGNLGTSAQPSI